MHAIDVAVVGPGAIGATVAAALQEAGRRPILCGRTPREQIVVAPDDGPSTVLDGAVLTDPERLAGTARHVLLAVKAHQTEGASAWLRKLAGPGTVVTVLQNGIEQRELVAPLAPAADVVPSVVWFPAEQTAPGHVRQRGTPQLTVPDEPAGRAVAELLAETRCAVEVAADFPTAAWGKLCQNAVAGLMVLVHKRIGAFADEGLADLARRYGDECAAVGRAEGAPLPEDTGAQIVARMRSYAPDQGTSILFDFDAGRPLEWDARNAVVQRRAAPHGVPTPIGDVIVPLLRAASA